MDILGESHHCRQAAVAEQITSQREARAEAAPAEHVVLRRKIPRRRVRACRTGLRRQAAVSIVVADAERECPTAMNRLVVVHIEAEGGSVLFVGDRRIQ